MDVEIKTLWFFIGFLVCKGLWILDDRLESWMTDIDVSDDEVSK